jgi:urease accessory protein
VRSSVEIVARAAAGRTALVRMQAEGQLAVRATGSGRVHLVGTAAGPLGGDQVEVLIDVGPGAQLAVHGVAATLALPGGHDGWGYVTTTLTVADGAELSYAPGPLVACRGARLRTVTSVVLTGSGQAEVVEQLVLGRHGEPGGAWSGRLVADRDGRPVLRTTQCSALIETATVPGGGTARALVTRLLTGATAVATTQGGAVCCPLAAGGALVTSFGADLTSALADADVQLRGAGLPDPLPDR